MNIGEEIASQLLEESTPIIALYPGKFKPPHAGHFSAIEKAANIADKVVVIMSNIPKDEFTPEESMKVWKLYKNILPNNVQIIISEKPSPLNEVFDMVKDKTQDFIVLYGKGERSRYTSIERDREKYSNVDIVDAGTFDDLHATDLRTSIRNKDLEDIQKFLPTGIDAKKVLDIYSQNEFKPNQILHESYSQSLNYFKNGDIFAQGKSERNTTLKKYNNRKQISEIYNIPFKTNILLETFTPQKAPLMKKFVEYVCNELEINEPKIHIKNSPTYSQKYKSFGGYIPSEEKIIVVVHNRNMADILRTLAHELVHHYQKLNGDELNGEDGSDTENEANAKAGVIMRKFGRENPEIFENELNENDPKVGTGKKPEGSSRRLYTDENPKDTVGIKFKTKEDIVDTLNKTSFKAKPHVRQSQVINLIHQRVRAAYGKAKDPDVKARLKRGLDYIEKRKEMSKKKTERLRKQKTNENQQTNLDTFDRLEYYKNYFINVSPSTFDITTDSENIVISGINKPYPKDFNDVEDTIQVPVISENIDFNNLEELVTATQVICDNCGWEWKIVDGGKDPYLCHKCNNDNTPE